MVQYASELEINHSIKDVYNFLSNISNIGMIMPQHIVNWTVTEDTCNFSIGFAKIRAYYTEMRFSSQIEDQVVELESFGKSEIYFNLRFNLSIKDDKTLVLITFETQESSFATESCPSKLFLENVIKSLPEGLVKSL